MSADLILLQRTAQPANTPETPAMVGNIMSKSNLILPHPFSHHSSAKDDRENFKISTHLPPRRQPHTWPTNQTYQPFNIRMIVSLVLHHISPIEFVGKFMFFNSKLHYMLNQQSYVTNCTLFVNINRRVRSVGMSLNFSSSFFFYTRTTSFTLQHGINGSIKTSKKYVILIKFQIPTFTSRNISHQ